MWACTSACVCEWVVKLSTEAMTVRFSNQTHCCDWTFTSPGLKASTVPLVEVNLIWWFQKRLYVAVVLRGRRASGLISYMNYEQKWSTFIVFDLRNAPQTPPPPVQPAYTNPTFQASSVLFKHFNPKETLDFSWFPSTLILLKHI